MKSLVSTTRAVLLVLIISMLFLAPEQMVAQGQYFLDETASRLPEIEDRSGDGALCDIDEDGDLDIVVATGSGHRAYLVKNDGMGFFPSDSLQDLFPTVHNFAAVAPGDIDWDGDLDLLFPAFGEKNRLLVRNDDGSFVDDTEERFPHQSTGYGTDGAFVDVDGDLYLDISISQYGNEKLWLNDGRGYFSSGALGSGWYDSNALVWGDVDGDLDADCVVAENTGWPNKLMINDGDGLFSDETEERLPEDLGQSNGVGLVDLDGDNDLDIVITNGWFPGHNKVWINDGFGFFTDESELRIPQYGNVSDDVSCGDIDNDGDADLLISNRTDSGDANKVFINDGDGFFTDETETRYPDLDDDTNTIELGDIDSDGDLDCFVVNVGPYSGQGQQNRLLVNVSIPDSFPPVIPRTYHHPDTGDTTSSYLITTTVWDNISIVIGELEVSLFYRALGDTSSSPTRRVFTEIPMVDCGGFLHRERIPAQSSISTVEYYIKAEDRMGNIVYDPPNAPDSVFSFLVDVNVGIGDDPSSMPSLPKAFSLAQNYPNPLNPSTTVNYNVPEGEEVNVIIQIFDIRGRFIRSLVQEEKNPGKYSVHWDGRNDRGEVVGSGVYLCRMEAEEFISTRKMTVVR